MLMSPKYHWRIDLLNQVVPELQSLNNNGFFSGYLETIAAKCCICMPRTAK